MIEAQFLVMFNFFQLSKKIGNHVFSRQGIQVANKWIDTIPLFNLSHRLLPEVQHSGPKFTHYLISASITSSFVEL